MRFDARFNEPDDPVFPHKNVELCWTEFTKDGVMTVMTSTSGTPPFATTVDVYKSHSGVNAHGVMVKFQENDFKSTSSTESGRSTSSTTATTSTIALGSNADPSESGKGELKKGASVGVGVSVGLLTLAAVVGGVHFLLRSRQRRRRGKQLGVEAYRSQGMNTPEWKSADVAVYKQPSPAPQQLQSIVHHAPGTQHAPQALTRSDT
jgi:hypothetical protein